MSEDYQTAPENSVWAISTGGVGHDPADARAMVFIGTNGESGLVASGGGDLKVTPGKSDHVRVHPCSVVARSRYPGRVDESYAFRVKRALDVKIRPASSTPASGRTDAIILRVHDPVIEGSTVPDTAEALQDYNYWSVDVIEGIPGSVAKTEEAISAYKKIDYPFVLIGTAVIRASQSAVDETNFLANMIMPRTYTPPPIIHKPSKRFKTTQTGSYYEDMSAPLRFDVPEWARWATFDVIIAGFHLAGNNGRGKISAYTMSRALPSSEWNMDLSDGGSRSTQFTGGRVSVSEQLRGTSQTLVLRVSNELRGSTVTIDEKSIIKISVTFHEVR
ncbi:hypothetical protein QDX23_03540 [Auritidibacter ignavus]|uniref:hypothetical protein n=1 Tax=Auritidibacter TaxID=1160973 RepID=UPI000D73B25D|nr:MULTISPECIES: hypothetical protein [Auritidibacter]PXA77937.1 hypothetical protein DCC24_03315 [Auritidibacter sp. NML100628]WGH91453.1 hypothetical protein QDX23_03540 [Auritidibacter ignavus]